VNTIPEPKNPPICRQNWSQRKGAVPINVPLWGGEPNEGGGGLKRPFYSLTGAKESRKGTVIPGRKGGEMVRRKRHSKCENIIMGGVEQNVLSMRRGVSGKEQYGKTVIFLCRQKGTEKGGGTRTWWEGCAKQGDGPGGFACTRGKAQTYGSWPPLGDPTLGHLPPPDFLNVESSQEKKKVSACLEIKKKAITCRTQRSQRGKGGRALRLGDDSRDMGRQTRGTAEERTEGKGKGREGST